LDRVTAYDAINDQELPFNFYFIEMASSRQQKITCFFAGKKITWLQ
jgi:hypothetical protein